MGLLDLLGAARGPHLSNPIHTSGTSKDMPKFLQESSGHHGFSPKTHDAHLISVGI